MWSQSWSNLYPLLKPASSKDTYDLSETLVARKTGATEMSKYAERFYTSIGMETLPQTFWERSLLTKPRPTAKWCATPRPGRWTASSMCA
ncbi:M2 family metallopeptidase [Massilia sp. H-1]|nr:M2 family metallopeptidase [Massilia sp. H-1]